MGRRIATVGWILIVIGVIGEGVFEAFVVVADSKLEEITESGLAASFDRAAIATQRASDAQASARGAAAASSAATAGASNALLFAGAARMEADSAQKEADSFEKDIASAKQQATEAESHLNEAMKRAKEVTAELERLTTPRHFPYSSQTVVPLKTYQGTEYVFVGTCDDQECFDLVWQIKDVLEAAGWKRIKGPAMRIGISQVNIHQDKDFAVDLSVSTGIVVSVETPGGLESVKDLAADQQSEHIRAAIALNHILALNVSPTENTGKSVGVDAGTSTTVRIDIGRKPIP